MQNHPKSRVRNEETSRTSLQMISSSHPFQRTSLDRRVKQ
ncbi:unnamed protein product [Acanthoscelides obtectus]|uniref:Uncharacterized protein n=1 Tax=Acanthoscelides obtectus TaxID=200917 RepID=A0A9P0MCF2_ACAOB|nr:unnamed protein product [Acanthoscelides obtectus]CAK1664520.1 hypothetical protein AOBTE_LOCUS24307 [Acanthoscelides obtectus]